MVIAYYALMTEVTAGTGVLVCSARISKAQVDTKILLSGLVIW